MENEGVKKNALVATHDSVEEQQPPMRSVLCLKNKKLIKEIEKVEECFILNFDPYESEKLSSLSKCSLKEDDHDSDLTILAEHGKVVACRDFPHARHQCAEYPFSTTPHESYCKLCHCYVCDVAAPCKHWSSHCSATYTPPLALEVIALSD